MIMTGLQEWNLNTEDEKEDYSEEDKEYKDYTESENDDNEDQDEDFEAEEDIDEDELEYLEEDIKVNYYNPVNEEQYDPIQEDQEEIEIPGVNENGDTDSISSNVIISYRERHPLEILGPTVKGQLYMQTYKMKEIDKHTKEEPIIRFWEETNKRITQK